MIDVLFFAQIRQRLGVDRLSIPLADDPTTLAMLRQQLIDSQDGDHSREWQAVLSANNIVKAVNQEVVDDSHILVNGDEVAFFPPVTGG